MALPTIGMALEAVPFIKRLFESVLTDLATGLKAAIPDSAAAVDQAVSQATEAVSAKLNEVVAGDSLLKASEELKVLWETHQSEAPPNPAGLI